MADYNKSFIVKKTFIVAAAEDSIRLENKNNLTSKWMGFNIRHNNSTLFETVID